MGEFLLALSGWRSFDTGPILYGAISQILRSFVSSLCYPSAVLLSGLCLLGTNQALRTTKITISEPTEQVATPMASSQLTPPGTGGPPILASRLSRLGAKLIDVLINSAISLPMLLLTGGFNRVLTEGLTVTETITLAILGFVSYLVVHGYFIATQGQTIGKKLVGIKMVDHASGELVSLAKIIFLRDLPLSAVNFIPLFGSCISLIDILAIFGSQQRCIHDHLAGTKVVRA